MGVVVKGGKLVEKMWNGEKVVDAVGLIYASCAELSVGSKTRLMAV